MKVITAAALIVFAVSSYAEPDEQGKTFYTQNTVPRENTVKRFVTDAKEWMSYNLMTESKTAKPVNALSQAGSFSTSERANAHAAWLKLNNNGARTRVERASVNNIIRYRVFIESDCKSVKNQPGCGCLEVAK